MKLIAVATAVMTLLASVRTPEDAPKSDPQKQHAWLRQLVGEWEADIELPPEDGKPARVVKASERIRAVGEYWIVSDGEVALPSDPIKTVLTLGYDPEKRQFIGTWIDSTSSFLWTYRGTLDAAGKTLTLEAEGPGPEGAMSKFKDVIELKDKDHKVNSNFVQSADGTWTRLGIVTCRRTQ